jgi:hypothetical protein
VNRIKYWLCVALGAVVAVMGALVWWYRSRALKAEYELVLQDAQDAAIAIAETTGQMGNIIATAKRKRQELSKQFEEERVAAGTPIEDLDRLFREYGFTPEWR